MIGLAVVVTFALDRAFRMPRLELAAAAIVTTQIIIAAFLGIVLWSLFITPRNPENEIGFAAIYDLAARWLWSLVVTISVVSLAAAGLRRELKDDRDVE